MFLLCCVWTLFVKIGFFKCCSQEWVKVKILKYVLPPSFCIHICYSMAKSCIELNHIFLCIPFIPLSSGLATILWGLAHISRKKFSSFLTFVKVGNSSSPRFCFLSKMARCRDEAVKWGRLYSAYKMRASALIFIITISEENISES